MVSCSSVLGFYLDAEYDYIICIYNDYGLLFVARIFSNVVIRHIVVLKYVKMKIF